MLEGRWIVDVAGNTWDITEGFSAEDTNLGKSRITERARHMEYQGKVSTGRGNKKYKGTGRDYSSIYFRNPKKPAQKGH